MARFRDFLKYPGTIAFAYVLLSLAWIFLTDLAVAHAGISQSAATAISMVKGCIFVVVTALLIFYLLRRAFADRERFRALLESAPDAMVIVDRSGKILLVNARAEKLFGYQRAELIGQPVELLVPERFKKQHPLHRERMLDSGQQSRQLCSGLELFGLRKDGSEFPAEISLSPIRTVDGLVVSSDIRDISERKLADEQIKKLNRQLEDAVRRSAKLAETGGLVATLAHEINNPLESLGNLLYLLNADAELAENAKMLATAASEEIARLRTIAQQTLAPHRGETKDPVATRLPNLLDDVISLFDRKLKSAGITVSREYSAAGAVLVHPGDFRQVFINLVANAIDAMPDGGELHLVIGNSAAGEVVVQVSDTGCGIAPEHVDAIFEPFFTTKGENGTGIGLWVIKGIVERSRGRIEVVSSSTGKTGTCFSLYLPAFALASRFNCAS